MNSINPSDPGYKQIVFRIKDLDSGKYWCGDNFSKDGIVYTSYRAAHVALTRGKLPVRMKIGLYTNVEIVPAKIIDEL